MGVSPGEVLTSEAVTRLLRPAPQARVTPSEFGFSPSPRRLLRLPNRRKELGGQACNFAIFNGQVIRIANPKPDPLVPICALKT
jgi:hypothetical protein